MNIGEAEYSAGDSLLALVLSQQNRLEFSVHHSIYDDWHIFFEKLFFSLGIVPGAATFLQLAHYLLSNFTSPSHHFSHDTQFQYI